MKIPATLKLRHAADKASSDLPALLAAAEKAAQSILAGEHNMRKPGHGESFWQFRDYQPQDNPNEIDWRQSAKGDRVFIRQKEKQTPQPIALWCAAGPSMDYSSGREIPTKAWEAAVTALALSLLLTRRGEHVSLLGGRRRPGRSEYTLSRLAEQLIGNLRSGSPLPVNLSEERLPRGHTAVLLGDFLRPAEEIEAALRQVNTTAGSGLLIQILDQAEISLPFTGRIIYCDPETGKRVPVDNSADIRNEYLDRIDSHLAAVRQICRGLGWEYFLHITDSPVSSTLIKIWDALGNNRQSFQGAYK